MKTFLLSSLILALAPAVYAQQSNASAVSEQWIAIPTHSFKKSHQTRGQGKLNSNSHSSNESEPMPNDENYDEMYYWHSQTQSIQIHKGNGEYRHVPASIGSSEINAAVNSSKQNRKLRIAVIDGGFNEHDDIPWQADEGHNFFQAFGQEINPQWRSLDDPNNCESGHGNAVGGIIGATANNGAGVAGVLDAEIIPIRAFECNMARTIDIADAIRYAAGDKVKNAPVIAKVDLINISSEAFNGQCHEPLQQAIDYAVNAGIQVYASAGNSNIEVTSKCDGVVLVGGTNERRTKWSNSNYGSAIDVMTAGYNVYSYNFSGTTGWWEGTSFATPLAVSVHGLALQHDLAINHDDIINLIKLTAQPMSTDIDTAAEDCSGERCGAGLINAKRMMNYLIATSEQSPYQLKHALSSVNECDQTLYLSTLGNASRLCQLYELHIAQPEVEQRQEVQFVRVAKGSLLIAENAQLIHAGKESVMLIDDIDTEQYDYGIRFCSLDACSDALIYPVDSTQAQQPSQCNKQ